MCSSRIGHSPGKPPLATTFSFHTCLFLQILRVYLVPCRSQWLGLRDKGDPDPNSHDTSIFFPCPILLIHYTIPVFLIHHSAAGKTLVAILSYLYLRTSLNGQSFPCFPLFRFSRRLRVAFLFFLPNCIPLPSPSQLPNFITAIILSIFLTDSCKPKQSGQLLLLRSVRRAFLTTTPGSFIALGI